MIETSSVSEAVADSAFDTFSRRKPTSTSAVLTTSGSREGVAVFLSIVTASVATHLLAIAFLGSGVPAATARPRIVSAPAPVEVVESVTLVPEPPPPPDVKPVETDPLPPSPEPAAALDLPPVEPIQAIAAVPSTVPVAFGLEVTGPVKLVRDASLASGSGGARRPRAEPISLDDNAAAQRSLLLPTITYPADAKRRRLTGAVIVEFRTSPTGDIYDVRVRESSGHASLDRAALGNLRLGRWTGAPGYYLKAYEFTLQ